MSATSEPPTLLERANKIFDSLRGTFLYVHQILSNVGQAHPPFLMFVFLVAPFVLIYAAAEENTGFTMRLREIQGSMKNHLIK